MSSDEQKAQSVYAMVDVQTRKRGAQEVSIQIGFDSDGYCVLICGDPEDPTAMVTMSPTAAAKLSAGLERAARGAMFMLMEALDPDARDDDELAGEGTRH